MREWKIFRAINRNTILLYSFFTVQTLAMKPTLISLLFLMQFHFINAQGNNAPAPIDNSAYLKIYLDGVFSYEDYIKQNVMFVNYVRDRFEADVHLIVASQTTGSNGVEYTLFFLGQQRFVGKNDTLNFIANTNNTEDETRTGLTNMIKLGLMRYIAFLPEASKINITFGDSSSTLPAANPKDKWHNWVFTISANLYMSGEQSYNNLNGSGSISAKKVTDQWKINFSSRASINKNHYSVGDFTYDSKTDSKSLRALIVKSKGEHWSLGSSAFVVHSTYSNYDFHVGVSPGVEYNFFPYSKSSSKLFTLLYQVTPTYQKYIDTTIFNKTKELLVAQSLQATLSLTEKWGTVSTSLGGSNYFYDLSKNSVFLSSSLQWRIVSGLSFNLFSYVSLIHDQTYLPKAGATDAEILTQQRQLATDYNYYVQFGISYTFGSLFNNVVNSRFNSEDSF